MKLDSTYINNRIRVFENKNEFIFSFSCATDITNLRKSNEYKKDLDSDYYSRFGQNPEPMININDIPVSFKKEDGSINWDGLTEYVNSKDSSYKKSMSSIYRAKSTIYDLMQSNYWEFFVTITINPNSPFWKNTDIKNVKEVQYKLTERIRNINKRKKGKIEYVLIPEYQENGNVHFHGVIRGIDKEDLDIALNNQEYMKDENGNILIDEKGDKVPNKYYKTPLVRKGNQVYNYSKFADIGYNDFETIRDMSRVGSYCTKYITKDLFERASEYGSHLYICSQGLERKKEVYTREIDSFRYLTDEEIKEKIGDSAYIVRTPYNTKIYINKAYMHDKNRLVEFADSIEGNTIEKGINDISSSKKLLDILPSLSNEQRESIGVSYYNPLTGEIEFTKNKPSIVDVSINPDTGERMYEYRDTLSFRQMKHEDIEKIVNEQVRLW